MAAGDRIRPEATDLMELSRDERANRLLGRLLQVFPEDSVETHTETVEQTLEATTPHTLQNCTAGRTFFGLGRAILGHGGRPFVVAEHGYTGQHTVFYRSNSHAVWRAMLSWASDGYIAKGMFGAENSTDAPIALQRGLSKVAEEDVLEGEAYKKVLLALVNDRPDMGGPGVADKIAEGKMRGAWMELSPTYSSDEIASGDRKRPFVEGKEPDLDKLADAWVSGHPLYGSVTSRIYPSADGTVNYLVNSASYNDGQRNQHWIGTAEIAGQSVTGLGLTRSFIEIPKEFLEPPIDYAAPNADEYGERRWKMTRLETIFFLAGIKAEL